MGVLLLHLPPRPLSLIPAATTHMPSRAGISRIISFPFQLILEPSSQQPGSKRL